MLYAVCGLILVALIFDYINGFHDAANSIATVVSTRVLSPGQAVVWAAFFNFIAAFVWALSFAGFGYIFGHALEAAMGDIADNFLYIMFGVFVFAASILYFVHRSQARKAAARAAAKPDKIAAD